jgi:hypothetical protein
LLTIVLFLRIIRMVVKQIHNRVLWDSVVLEAEKYQECTVEHFFGPRRYYINEGRRIRVNLPKSWCLEVGDIISLKSVVLHLGGLSSKISWDWEY